MLVMPALSASREFFFSGETGAMALCGVFFSGGLDRQFF
jgi:hypothetical protein